MFQTTNQLYFPVGTSRFGLSWFPTKLLVGGIPTPLKNMKINWDDDIPNIWKNKSHVPVTTKHTSIIPFLNIKNTPSCSPILRNSTLA